MRGQVFAIMLGAIFVFVGLLSCAIAAIRGHGGIRMLVWFGILNALYGARILLEVPELVIGVGLSASQGQSITAIINYLIIVPGLLFWLELSLRALRRFLQIAATVALLVGIAGVYSIFMTESPGRFMLYTTRLLVLVFVVLGVVVSAPRLARHFGIMRSRVSATGTLALALTALYTNLADYLHLPRHWFLEPLAFAAFVFSLGYVATQRIFNDERRLLSIESELAVARDIQNSILPVGVPEMGGLRISAAYRPMTAVAGDFYEFIPVDQNRFGVLLADVSGHGVPAALIAAMIKVAMQSVVHHAPEPREVLRGLSRILSGQLRGQLISAAYLWLDTDSRIALYSAAGHPPLLCWRSGILERIESNGLLIGILPDADYPVCEIPLHSGDRFLLYTDGVVEPENAGGEAFGDHKLEQVIRNNQSLSPAELSDQLLMEVGRWQPASVTQQDDITLIVIDIA